MPAAKGSARTPLGPISGNITNGNIGTRFKCVKIRTDVLKKMAGFAMTNIMNKMRNKLELLKIF